VVYGCVLLLLYMCFICCTYDVGYAVLCTYRSMYMLYMQCYVHIVLHACCTCGAMYICCVHVENVVLCTVEILNNKHIFNGDYPDHVLLWNTYTIHKLLYVDHQYSSINNNKTSRAFTH